MSDDFLSKLPLGALGDNAVHEPAWLSHLRNEAADRLRTEGLPTRKTEAWRFTDLRSILSVPFSPTNHTTCSKPTQARVESHLGEDGSVHLFVVNGRPVDLPEGLPTGLQASRLAQMLIDEPDAVQPHLARYARSQFFGAINSALFDDGLVLRVRAGNRIEAPIQIVYVMTDAAEPTVSYPRTLVIAEAGSQLSLIETYLSFEGSASRTLTTAVTEIALDAGAIVDHLRICEGGSAGHHVGTVAVDQKRDSQYTSRSVALGGALCRVDIDVTMHEPGASCRLDGAYHATRGELVDHHTRIVHAAEHCSSNEEYKGIADGSGHAVFDGTIVVARGAQKTSAHQQNHNLLLSDQATVHTKPHLEIDADDVSCSHGATIGALDESALFYLRARGIGRSQAEAMLTFSFVRTILDRIAQPAIRHRLLARVIDRLPSGHEIRELSL